MSVIELFLVLVRRTVEIHGMYSFAVVEVYILNSPKIIQRYLKSSKIKQILRKLAKTA